MRVLHLSDYDAMGGAEVVFNQSVQASRALGHETQMMVSDGTRRPLTYVWSRRNAELLAARLRAFRPDILHLQNYYHFWSPSILHAVRSYRRQGGHVRVVLTAHDFHLICPNSFMVYFRGTEPIVSGEPGMYDLLTKKYDHRSHAYSALKKAQYLLAYKIMSLRDVIDRIIAPSHYLRSVLNAHGVSTPVSLVRNPVALPSDPPSAVPPREGVVYFGRITPVKGTLDAARQMAAAGIGLDVIGEGEDLDALRTIASTTPLIRVRGAIAHDHLLEEIRRYKVMILTSVPPENAPLTVLEAASRGVTVVCPSIGGAAEMASFTSSNELYDPDAPGALVAAVRRALSMTEPNRLLHPENFTQEAYQHALGEVYLDIMDA